MKIDYLPLGNVRTDPIINPDCLSDHVHTFYGANKLRPETSYEDLRNAGGAADGSSGNVAENLSLYWHPAVYEIDPDTGIHRLVTIDMASTYYIWNTGQATAFPDGFKMVAGFGGVPEARAQAECVAPFPCERDNCESDDTSFFPATGCGELEASMAFPTCWDGVNIDSEDHMSHVAYDMNGGSFDGECPDTHPVKLPEIQFFFRILEYKGGPYRFADGTSFYHADYFSGWNQDELQAVLDTCVNDSEAASPDAWCEDHVTFRDAPKDADLEFDELVIKLQQIQPDTPFDTSTITTEATDNVVNLPRGACTGTLIPAEPSSPASSPPTAVPSPPTPSPSSRSSCEDSVFRFKITGSNGKTMFKPCSWVARVSTAARCEISGVAAMCPKTCNTCSTCEDSSSRMKINFRGRKISRNCKWTANNPAVRCEIEDMPLACRDTCGLCE
jgi:hypothetical protein